MLPRLPQPLSLPVSQRISKLLPGLLGALLLSQAPTASALDLLSAYRQATGSDAIYLSARATADAAREALPIARAQLLPQVGLSAQRSRNNTEQTSFTAAGPRSSDSEYAAKGYNLSLRQPLFRLGSYYHYEQAKSLVAAAETTLDKEFQAVALRVGSAYFDALLAHERLAAIRAQIEFYRGQQQLARHYLEHGEGTRTDIDEAQARLDLAVAQEIQIRNLIAVAERTLSSILGQRVPATSLAPLDPARLELNLPQPENLEAWLERAAANNPEVATLRHNLEAAGREIDKARAGHYPTADVVMSQSLSNSENNYTIGSEYRTSSIGVQINIPLYAGGGTEAGVRQALANRERIRYQLEATERQLETNVTREYSGVQDGVARSKALEQAVHSARQALVATEKGVVAGTRHRVDVLDAQQRLFAAETSLTEARHTYAVARLRLQGAVGELSEADILAINAWLAQP